MIIGSALTQVTDKEEQEREKMFIMPESEKNPRDVKRTLAFAKAGISVGAIVFVGMLVLWIIPYMKGLGL